MKASSVSRSRRAFRLMELKQKILKLLRLHRSEVKIDKKNEKFQK